MSEIGRTMVRCGMVLALAACAEGDAIAPPGGGGPPPALNVTSTQPASGAANVELGTTVTAFLDVAPVGSTVTIGSAQLAAGTSDVVRRVLGLGQPPSVEMIAALRPGTAYTATLTTGVSGGGGQRLPAPFSWTFSTRAPQIATLSLLAPVAAQVGFARDSVSGRLHLTAPDSVDDKLDYFTCLTNCGVAASWSSAVIDSSVVVGGFSAIAVGPAPDARLHVVYRSQTNGNLLYATCLLNCTQPNQFTRGIVDSLGDVGGAPSLAVDENERLHVVFQEIGTGLFKYATCSANCTVFANWTRIQLSQFPPAGASSAIAIDPANNRVHTLYQNDATGILLYATCLSSCGNIASWVRGAVTTTADNGRAPALVVDDDGRLHATYHDALAGDLRYITCTTGCDLPSNWSTVSIAGTQSDLTGISSAIAVDRRERLYTVFWDDTDRALRYGTCPSNCLNASRWLFAGLDSLPAARRSGSSPRMVLSPAGKVSAAFLGAGDGEVKYWE